MFLLISQAFSIILPYKTAKEYIKYQFNKLWVVTVVKFQFYGRDNDWLHGKKSVVTYKAPLEIYGWVHCIIYFALYVSRCCLGQLLIARSNFSKRGQILEFRSLLGVSDWWIITTRTCNEMRLSLLLSHPINMALLN